MGAPISVEIAWAMSFTRALVAREDSLEQRHARSATDVCENAGKAALAAATALATSALPPAAILAKGRSVEGSITFQRARFDRGRPTARRCRFEAVLHASTLPRAAQRVLR